MPAVLSNRLVRGEAFAAGVKLRRVGPIASASVAHCIVEPPPASRGGSGEKCLQ